MGLNIVNVELRQTLKGVDIEASILPRKFGVLQTILQEHALRIVWGDDTKRSPGSRE